nr:reverse transcriptase domain-containing protein [Tanacetum cinerariifolium]
MYNTKLANLLPRHVYSPCVVNWDVLNGMGCDGEIDDMLRIKLRKAESNKEIFTILAWIRAFSIKEPNYVELCHKFYSTYEFDEVCADYELQSKKIINFRLGGRAYDLTLLEFARRLGLYHADELEEDGFDDANVAWLIMRWLKRKGAGTQRESQICCGQFIMKIAKKARVLTDVVLRSLSALIYCEDLDMTTLRELIDSGPRWDYDPRKLWCCSGFTCMQTRSSSRLVSNPSSNPTPSTNPNPKGRNRRRSKQRIEEFNLDELSPPIVTMADQPIIESKSKVRYSRNKPVVAKVSTNTSTSGISPDVAELKDMVKALLLDKKSQNQSHAPVKAVEESCVTCGGAHSYRNCLATDGNVYRDNIQEFVSHASVVNYNQGNTSYRPPMINNFNQGPVYQPSVFQPLAYQAPAYQAPAPQTQGVSKEDFLAYVKANDAVMRNMQTQGQNMQNQLTNLTDLITKFVNSNSASTSSSGTLPSNTIAKPISDLKAITTRSGVSYDGPQIPPSTSFLPKVVENEPEATKDTMNPTNNESTKDVQPQVVQSESTTHTSEPVTSPISEPVIALSYSIVRYLVWLELQKMSTLRRSFLKTERALIDVFEGELTLRVDKEAITFNLDQTSRYLASYSDMTTKRIDVIGMACEEYSQEVLGFSNTISSGNPTPYYDPIISTTSPTLTPFEKSDFLLEEVDSFLAIEDDPTSPKFYQPYLDPEGDILLLEAFLNDDPSLPPPNQGNYLPEVRKELKICEAKSDKSSVDEPPELNEATRKDHFPLPFMDQMLERLAGNQYYCFLDGFSGYFQIPIDLKDQEKTIFTCPHGTFAYRRMPFGLCNAPSMFQRCMMAIFHDMIKKTMEVFMDDFSVFRNSFQSCLSCLERMIKRCEDTNLCLNWEKSHFMVKEGIVLGYKISEQGIEVDKAKVDVINKLPHPTTVKGIRNFLGHAGFYRRFIKDFSKIATPMTRLLEKDTPFIFSQECVEPFQTLKRKLTEAPILIAPDWDIPFELMCDASDFFIGAIVGQRQDKHFKPIHYASKTMTEAKSNYTTTKKEMLVVVYAFEKFRSCLIMNKSIVYTDHFAQRAVGENRMSWSDKLDDALWAFCTAYKTPIG